MLVCSWPGFTVSMPRNNGRFLYAFKYSSCGYWNSLTVCQRHMLRLAPEPETSPLGVMPELTQVVVGPWPVTKGYAGVASDSSSANVQLRLPLPPCPA